MDDSYDEDEPTTFTNVHHPGSLMRDSEEQSDEDVEDVEEASEEEDDTASPVVHSHNGLSDPETQLRAWKQVRSHLIHAVEVAREAIAAKKLQRRFWLEELYANLQESGTLTSTSTWKKPPKKAAAALRKRKKATPKKQARAKKDSTGASSSSSAGPKKKKLRLTIANVDKVAAPTPDVQEDDNDNDNDNDNDSEDVPVEDVEVVDDDEEDEQDLDEEEDNDDDNEDEDVVSAADTPSHADSPWGAKNAMSRAANDPHDMQSGLDSQDVYSTYSGPSSQADDPLDDETSEEEEMVF